MNIKAEPDQPPADISQKDWRESLAEIGKKEGYYQELGKQHSALFVEREDTLIVTFENLDHVYERGEDRMPWGYDFVKSRGWSMLGLMAHDWTWYRDDAVFDFFDRLRNDGFFDRFKTVVFYGASMGAYAACVFSSAAPGATVICISPQATLARDVASWETRYRKAWRRDFSGRYGFAPDMIQDASAVHMFFDPTAPLDAMHAALFQGENVTKYNCRFMGHRIASLWLRMAVLKPVIVGCVQGDMTPPEFYRMLRVRKDNPRYQKEMLARIKESNRPALLARYCQAVLNTRRAPVFRRELNIALKALGRKA